MTNLVDLAPLRNGGKPGAGSFGRRLKRAILPMGTIEAFLNLDGQHAYKMEGWPPGAKIVGADLRTKPFALIVYLYHPDFLVVPIDELPPLIKILARRA